MKFRIKHLYPIISFIAALMLLLGIVGCRSAKPVVITQKISETTTETVRDTSFQIAADTSSYKASLGYENGLITIKNVSKIKPGKKALLAPKVKIIDNELTVDCEARAQELLAQWIEKNTVKSTESDKPIFIQPEPTLIQEIQIWAGRLLFLLLLIVVIILIVRNKIKPKG